MKRRVLSLLLALLLAVSVLPFSASAADVVAIDENSFPDIHFRFYVANNIDADGSGDLSSEEIANTTYVSAGNAAIRDFQGIELFPALRSVDCTANELTSLDVSKNTALLTLWCYGNKLTSLNMSKNTALLILLCENNQLTSLDLSGCTALSYLDCRDNKLTSLDVSGCPALETLDCHNNSIGTLDISGCPNLITAYLQGKQKPRGGYTEYYINNYYLTVNDTTKVITEHQVKKPVIKTQPKTVTVKAGKKATFKVKAEGEGLKYQWFVKKTGAKKWVALKNAAKATLKFKATKKMNGWRYRCKVYNAAGAVYTKTVKLKVKK